MVMVVAHDSGGDGDSDAHNEKQHHRPHYQSTEALIERQPVLIEARTISPTKNKYRNTCETAMISQQSVNTTELVPAVVGSRWRRATRVCWMPMGENSGLRYRQRTAYIPYVPVRKHGGKTASTVLTVLYERPFFVRTYRQQHCRHSNTYVLMLSAARHLYPHRSETLLQVCLRALRFLLCAACSAQRETPMPFVFCPRVSVRGLNLSGPLLSSVKRNRQPRADRPPTHAPNQKGRSVDTPPPPRGTTTQPTEMAAARGTPPNGTPLTYLRLPALWHPAGAVSQQQPQQIGLSRLPRLPRFLCVDRNHPWVGHTLPLLRASKQDCPACPGYPGSCAWAGITLGWKKTLLLLRASRRSRVCPIRG